MLGRKCYVTVSPPFFLALPHVDQLQGQGGMGEENPLPSPACTTSWDPRTPVCTSIFTSGLLPSGIPFLSLHSQIEYLRAQA